MSTLMWDGAELVADSRLTYQLRLFGDCQFTWGRNTATPKLAAEEGFTWGSVPVQVFGAVGDLRVLRLLRMRNSLTREPVDLQNIASYSGVMKRQLGFTLIVVTKQFVATVATHPELGWVVPQVNTYPRATPLVVGTGKSRFKAALLTVGMNARLGVSWLRFLDYYTGGTLTVWDGMSIQPRVKPEGFLFSLVCAFWAHMRLGESTGGFDQQEAA